jgi:hypothetical protein
VSYFAPMSQCEDVAVGNARRMKRRFRPFTDALWGEQVTDLGLSLDRF